MTLPPTWHSELSVAKPCGPWWGGRVYQALERRVRWPRADRCRISDPVPSPEPVRPAVLASVSVPTETESVRFHSGSSGPASGSCSSMPSPDAVEKTKGPPGTTRRSCVGACRVSRLTAETSEVLPCGSVAVAVMMGRPAGAVKGTAKVTCPVASVVTSSEPR